MNIEFYHHLLNQLKGNDTALIAVSKTRSVATLQLAYQLGVRAFGENKVQELVDKQAALPSDIDWHFIGHLQRNKVKYIASFVHLIHGVDTLQLLEEIDRQAAKNNRKINCLLQCYIASEETKFGFNEVELLDLLESDILSNYKHITICGLMGMATNTEDKRIVKQEFEGLKTLFEKLKCSYFQGQVTFKELSMGMSGDYKIALEQGSTMVRIGSSLFGDNK